MALDCVQNRDMALWKRIGIKRASQVAIVIVASCALAFAQQSSSSNSDSSNPPDASTQQQTADQAAKDKTKDTAKDKAKDKKASENPPAKQPKSSTANPFPAAQSEAAAKAASQSAPPADQHVAPGDTPPAAPPQQAGSNSNGTPKHSTAQDNPFPEEKSKAAAKASGDQNQPPPGSSSSSSSPGVSSSDAHLPPQDLGEGKKGLHPERLDTYTRDMTNAGRVTDDLNAADLYMKTGNYRGGSMRYQDALRFDPQNETAAFGLAQALCKQNLGDKALQQYKSYLDNFPQGKYAGKAEKMLSDRKKCTHNR